MTETAQKRMFLRLVYRRAFRLFSIVLVVSALLGGIYGIRLYFIYGLSASGCLCLCAAWFTVSPPKDSARSRPFACAKRRRCLFLRRFKEAAHRPAFLMDYRNFDDDLTPQSAVDEAAFDRTGARQGKNALQTVLRGGAHRLILPDSRLICRSRRKAALSGTRGRAGSRKQEARTNGKRRHHTIRRE